MFSNPSRIERPLLRLTACLLLRTLCPECCAEEVPPRRAVEPFPLCDVRLLDGPLKHAQDIHEGVLLRYEPDRFLAWFRKEAGLEPKAAVYGGWESKGVAGHSLGHYLSACSLMYQATGKEAFKERVDYIVGELAACQQANGDGYVGAIPGAKRAFAQIAQGVIRKERFGLNGCWVPLYTQHKVFAGLRDAYRLCGNTQALEVERTLGDWLAKIVAGLSEAQMQEILYCEHGGINETLADLAVDAGDAKYLELAQRFHHKEVIDPCIAREDRLSGYHANTQVPKFTGLARVYEETGDPDFRTGAEFFWDRVAHHHSYVTGGHCLNEHFGEPDRLNDRLEGNTTETCNVYNMLKLTSHLFCWEPRAVVGDFYERALYNHILSSHHPVDGRVIYNLPIGMGVNKVYEDPFAFTCCVGTGMENHAKYGAHIYFHADDALYVNLFVASRLEWRAKGLTVTQETRFPEDDATRLSFSGLTEPAPFALCIRYPYWAVDGCVVHVNGAAVSAEPAPSGFIRIERAWRDGDAVAVRFPMSLRMETMPDNPDRRAILYGPLVLAGDLGPLAARASSKAPDFVPALVTDGQPIETWLKPLNNGPNRFQLEGAGRPRDVALAPFYAIYDRFYTIYWDFYTQAQWEEQQALRRAEHEARLALEARTVDFIQPGEQHPEVDHGFAGEHTSAGVGPKNRKWRHAVDGGWFAYDAAVNADGPLELAVTYWGSDVGARVFDVLVDGERIATQRLDNNRPGVYYEETYPLPEALVKGKHHVRLRFQAHEGAMAGGVFGIRVLKPE